MNTRELTNEETNALEQLIDTASLDAVLGALAQICIEKGDHLRNAWQDNVSASEWDRIAKRILNIGTNGL